MPVIDSVMKKLGFVKISKFGLVLTPEGRLMSMRPAVLDDGFGGRIVGWQDGDLAAAELAELKSWGARGGSIDFGPPDPGPARPASLPAVASRVAAARPPVPPIPTRAAPVAAAPEVMLREPVMPIIAVQPAVAHRIVAPPPVVEEDEWEWTIAIARARAAAEEVEVAVVAAQAPQRRMRADTVPPPMVATNPVAEAGRVTRVAPPTPSTVIPIPRMPSTANTSPRSSSMTPVVRQALPTPILPPAPRRFAKGTASVLPQSTSRIKPPTEAPAPAVSDDTIPSVALPPAAAAVALPSILRVTRG